jgi:hypothetical protein
MSRVCQHKQAPSLMPADRNHRGVVDIVQFLSRGLIQIPHEPDLFQRAKVALYELLGVFHPATRLRCGRRRCLLGFGLSQLPRLPNRARRRKRAWAADSSSSSAGSAGSVERGDASPPGGRRT